MEVAHFQAVRERIQQVDKLFHSESYHILSDIEICKASVPVCMALASLVPDQLKVREHFLFSIEFLNQPDLPTALELARPFHYWQFGLRAVFPVELISESESEAPSCLGCFSFFMSFSCHLSSPFFFFFSLLFLLLIFVF
jgi:hypothetical protein